MNLFKSKRRVADHGEVFIPAWMVEAMLDLVKSETERIDSRLFRPRAIASLADATRESIRFHDRDTFKES